MLVLGIDSATKVTGAAVIDEDKLVSERFISNQRTHSVNLLPMIQQVVTDAEIDPQGLDGIAVAAGPGSFTGLRIGMAAAKTLAQVLEIPLVGINTLDALAYNLAGNANLICPILDARKNEVYTAIYAWQGENLTTIIPPTALRIESLIMLLEKQGRPVTLLGDAVPTYGAEFVQSLGERVSFATKINALPRAAAVAQLGLEKIIAGERAGLDLQPNYIRLSEAEVTWQKKQLSGV